MLAKLVTVFSLIFKTFEICLLSRSLWYRNRVSSTRLKFKIECLNLWNGHDILFSKEYKKNMFMHKVYNDRRRTFLKIYFDNCCYNRLFDDRSNIINYLEREAVLIVMQKAYENEFEIIGSDILEIEISKIKNNEKRSDVEGIYHALVTSCVQVTSEIKERAVQIREVSSIKNFDSLHLASAEVGADVLLTTKSS